MARKQVHRKMGVGAIFGANLQLICDVRRINDEKVMEYMNICRATFYKKKRLPGEWKMEEVASASKLFGIPQTDLVSRMLTPEEVSV